MSMRFPQMDEKSLELDARYMGIKEKMSRVELHRQALTMLRESGLEEKYTLKHQQVHESAIKALNDEISEMKLAQIEDFLLLTDPETIDVLKMRYIDYLPWNEIANRCDRTIRWVQMSRNRGLHQIAEAKEAPGISV